MPEIAGQRLGRASLTRGIVGDSPPPRNNTRRTTEMMLTAAASREARNRGEVRDRPRRQMGARASFIARARADSIDPP
jgi:hypothetical protein